MALTLQELLNWPPEIGDLAKAATDVASHHADSADFLRSAMKASDWDGESGDTARKAVLSTAGDHDKQAEQIGQAASLIDGAHRDAEVLANKVKDILNFAAEAPGVQVDLTTNAVTPPPSYDYLDAEAQAKVAQKITEVKGRIAEALAQGNRIDDELAHAIAKASGLPPPTPSATNLPGTPPPAGTISEARRRALEYADRWAGDANDPHRENPDYENFGDGGGDCTNFASQVMRAGGFKDVGDGIDDWHRGDADDWYYNNGLHVPGNANSNTWSVAQANRDFIVNSGRGQVVGTSPMPASGALDPLAPSKAGLIPGDLIYYHDEASGTINHTAVYVGQQMQGGQLVDVVDQHANGDNNFRNDWMPDGPGFTGGPASVEFVHVKYPGE